MADTHITCTTQYKSFDNPVQPAWLHPKDPVFHALNIMRIYIIWNWIRPPNCRHVFALKPPQTYRLLLVYTTLVMKHSPAAKNHKIPLEKRRYLILQTWSLSSSFYPYQSEQRDAVACAGVCVRNPCVCCNASLLGLLWGCYCTTNLPEHFPDYSPGVSCVCVCV